MDFGGKAHLTGRKDWFVKINYSMKNKLKFIDETNLVANGIGDVLIMIRWEN